MEFADLAKDFALALAQGGGDLNPKMLAAKACDYAQALAEEIATRAPSPQIKSELSSEQVQEILARSNALISMLGWSKVQARDWLLRHFGKKSRLHLSDQELPQHLLLLIDELERKRKEGQDAA